MQLEPRRTQRYDGLGNPLLSVGVSALSSIFGGRRAKKEAARQRRAQDLANTPVPPPTPDGWVTIAMEDSPFSVPPNTTVRYGYGNQWVTKVVSGNGFATNGFFGSDPARGIIKSAQVQNAPASMMPSVPVAPVAASSQPVTQLAPSAFQTMNMLPTPTATYTAASDDRASAQFERVDRQASNTLPSWAIPTAVAGGVAVLLLLMQRGSR